MSNVALIIGEAVVNLVIALTRLAILIGLFVGGVALFLSHPLLFVLLLFVVTCLTVTVAAARYLLRT